MSEGRNALYAENYKDAVTALAKVVKMDAGYNDGEALFRLAEAYMGSGDNEKAATYFQRVVDEYGDSQYAEDASENLKTIKGSSDSRDNDDSGDSGSNGQ